MPSCPSSSSFGLCARHSRFQKLVHIGKLSEADCSELGKTPALAGAGRILISTARAARRSAEAERFAIYARANLGRGTHGTFRPTAEIKLPRPVSAGRPRCL